jgi:hypothetical protein
MKRKSMSKNLTRKGLAFGALVALGASVFAGAPAYAADTVVLAPNYSSDTTLATAVTGTFSLNASLAPGSTAGNIAQLAYKIVNNGAAQVDYSAVSGGNAADTGNVTSAEGNEYVTAATLTATALTANTLALSINGASATTTTQTVTVTAFIDANLNGTVEAGEAQASQTVSFVKHSEITSSTTITAPTENDTTVTAVVKFNNINNQSLTSANVGAVFTKGDGSTLTPAVPSIASGTIASSVATYTTAAAHGLVVGQIVTIAGVTGTTQGNLNSAQAVTAVGSTTTFSVATTGAGTISVSSATATPNNVYSNVAYSATAGGFKYVTSVQGTLAKGTAVKVQPLYSASALTASSGNTVGTAATSEVVARVLGSFVGNTVKSTTASAAASAAASVTQNVSLNGEKQVYFLAKDTATVAAAKAGQAVSVTVTVTGATLSATNGVTLTVNGTTYSAATALPGATGVAKLALTTGADGKATITYKTTGFANGNTVVFAATAENFSASVTGTETTRAYTTYISSNEGDTAATVDGTAVDVVLVTQDQFGAAPADGTFQINAVAVSNGQTTAATSGAGSDTFAAVVGGKTTLSLKDNGTGVGNVVFGLTRYTVNASGLLSAPTDFAGTSITASVWGTANGSLQFTLAVKTAADIAAGEVALTGNTTKSATTSIWTINASNDGNSAQAKALTYSDFAAVDLRAIVGSAPANTALDGTTAVTGLSIAGTVSSASTSTYASAAIPSAAVTVSAAGLQFSATQDGAAVYGVDSLTFHAGSNGAFTVSVWSHKAGKNTITIKSGTGTATVDVYFAAAAELAATTVTVTAADGAAQFQAGRALDVAVTVADKFGNPVALDATWAANTDAKLTIAQTGSGYLSTSGDVVVTSTGSYATKLITNAGDLGTSTITATLNYYDSTKTDVVKTVSSEFGVTDADVTVGGRAVYASVEFAKGKTVTVTVDGKRLYSKLFSTDAYTELKFTQKNAGKHTVTIRISGGIVYSEVVTTTK